MTRSNRSIERDFGGIKVDKPSALAGALLDCAYHFGYGARERCD